MKVFFNEMDNKFRFFSYLILLISLCILKEVASSKYIEIIESFYIIIACIMVLDTIVPKGSKE